jgi:TRAP-type mannitol/chloroaromatic compound transport system permease small subunit
MNTILNKKISDNILFLIFTVSIAVVTYYIFNIVHDLLFPNLYIYDTIFYIAIGVIAYIVSKTECAIIKWCIKIYYKVQAESSGYNVR